MKQLAFFLIIVATWIPAKAQDTITTIIDTTSVKQEKVADAEAEKLPWRARRFRLMVGGFFPINNTEVQVGNNSGDIGTDIDFEKDLGFKDNTSTFYANFMWRASKRSRFELEYFVLNRTASKIIDREIHFGDNVYPVSARVDAFFDSEIIRFTYGYAIVCKPKYEIGLLIGTHLMFVDVGLRIDTSSGNAEVSDDFNFTAPIPDLGIWSEIVLTKKMGLYANVNYLAIKIDNIDGRLISYNLSLLYNVYKNFSLTAGYTGLNIRVDVEKEKGSGYFKWGYNGPSLTATYTFGNFIKYKKK